MTIFYLREAGFLGDLGDLLPKSFLALAIFSLVPFNKSLPPHGSHLSQGLALCSQPLLCLARSDTAYAKLAPTFPLISMVHATRNAIAEAKQLAIQREMQKNMNCMNLGDPFISNCEDTNPTENVYSISWLVCRAVTK